MENRKLKKKKNNHIKKSKEERCNKHIKKYSKTFTYIIKKDAHVYLFEPSQLPN